MQQICNFISQKFSVNAKYTEHKNSFGQIKKGKSTGWSMPKRQVVLQWMLQRSQCTDTELGWSLVLGTMHFHALEKLQLQDSAFGASICQLLLSWVQNYFLTQPWITTSFGWFWRPQLLPLSEGATHYPRIPLSLKKYDFPSFHPNT